MVLRVRTTLAHWRGAGVALRINTRRWRARRLVPPPLLSPLLWRPTTDRCQLATSRSPATTRATNSF
ncbi:unnamed protein product [Leptosia nina]|uniref:Uncharacterized protein n=1 Tax=Leptosia nina TaxID=320188 RepID=A0AAV1JVM8_9NEOP